MPTVRNSRTDHNFGVANNSVAFIRGGGNVYESVNGEYASNLAKGDDGISSKVNDIIWEYVLVKINFTLALQ